VTYSSMRAVAYVIVLFIACANAVVHVPCDFADTPRGYECRLPDVDLSLFDEFAIIGGTHLPNRNDGMVVSFMSVNNNFRYFPTSDLVRFPGLRSIKISGSEITEILPLAVANRPLLTTLSLSNNYIDSIHVNAFQGTPNINELNLMFNRLRSIDNAVFSMFPNVLILDLSFNLLERIPANALVNNTVLMNINMNSNRISHVNQSFFDNFPGLTTFNFNANLCYSGSFFNLHLMSNRIDMFQRLSVCFVDGGVNFRCQFGFDFGGIDFDNRYTCMLRDVEAYDVGKTINLGGFHVGGRTNVDVLWAWVDASNVRFFIRQFFIDFINIQGVQVTASNLQVIHPGTFLGAINLRYLTFLLNDISRLEDNTFQFASNLEVIKFFHNNIEYVEENAFVGLSNLRELHLIGGSLTYLPVNTFQSLINLHLVDISHNLFGVLDSRWFTNNTMLSQMSFNDNRLYAIHPSIVDMPLLTTLRLRVNLCVDNVFTITPQTREQVRAELNPCFEAYPLRRQIFRLELEGDMNILDENGTIIGVL
jgi:Leucine-rich repeat (LRR) protein